MTAKTTTASKAARRFPLRSKVGASVCAAFALATSLAAGTASAAATLVIINGNAAGVGFNDTTPRAPVGGNPGTTLGAQRLNAFQAAANIWGATLTSSVPITILATFEPLTCTATSATLGSAGAVYVDANFPNAPRVNTFYPPALVSKIIGEDDDPTQPMIRARFNSNIGNPGCLTGTSFYLGYDNNHGSDTDLITVLLHEFGHGLGFQTYTNGQTGAFLANLYPAVWDYYLLDIDTNKTWNIMTNAERAASAVKPQKLVWTGAGVTAAVPAVLGGTPQLIVSSPSTVASNYAVGTASFGPPLTNAGVSGPIIPVTDQPNNQTGLACTPLSAANAAAVAGKIALVDRGVCTFNVKAQVVQAAGAIAMLVADNVPDNPPPGLGGTDPTITIPAVRVTQADGAKLRAAYATRSRRVDTTAIGRLALNTAIRAGADPFNRVFLYTPNPYQSGSSVSHFDVSALPNLLMEPAINGDLTHSVVVPQDLTFKLLQDIGW